jgi:3-methyl-2-oxobutanoate hydroxymethyltransferase
VTEELSEWISRQLGIPTIGIGAGAGCDGQVLVLHDMLQFESHSMPKKFVQTYANVGEVIRSGIAQYVNDVKERKFPLPKHAFQGDNEVITYLYGRKP